MVRITNDNLNADLEMVNELRNRDKAQMKRVEELESLVQSIREENEKAWNVVHDLRYLPYKSEEYSQSKIIFPQGVKKRRF